MDGMLKSLSCYKHNINNQEKKCKRPLQKYSVLSKWLFQRLDNNVKLNLHPGQD